MKTMQEERQSGEWKIAADFDSVFVLPIVATSQRPYLVLWNENDKEALLLELTVSWKDNLEQVEQRKVDRYEDLIGKYKEQGWMIESYYLPGGSKSNCNRFLCDKPVAGQASTAT